jgi:hypothetical protein
MKELRNCNVIFDTRTLRTDRVVTEENLDDVEHQLENLLENLCGD